MCALGYICTKDVLYCFLTQHIYIHVLAKLKLNSIILRSLDNVDLFQKSLKPDRLHLIKLKPINYHFFYRFSVPSLKAF